MLIFNLMPVYPLDGGQILQSLLWFVFGQARSLQIASVIGILGVVVLFGYAFLARDYWIGIMGALLGLKLPPGFGVAPSTLKHQAAQAAKAA